MLAKFKKIPFTRNIILLSAISFCTDVASEMLYPVFPLYFQSIGYSIFMIGLLEGLAEIVAGVSKTTIGLYSDKLQKKNIFITIGYGLSAFSKPLMGLTKSVTGIGIARVADRLGKGIRTTPRDAILAQESDPSQRGIVFGFHRSMDTFGASIGPVITLVMLFFYTQSYNTIFLLSAVPGAIAFVLTLMLKKEKKPESQVNTTEPKIERKINIKQFLKIATPEYKKIMVGLLLIGLLNSTDMFLLLRAKQLGLSDVMLITVYIFYNLIFAFAAIPVGSLSDKIGFKKIFMAGIVLISIVYGALGFGVRGLVPLFIVFAVYGVFAAIKEGVANAWISLHIPNEFMGTGLGIYFTLASFIFLLGNLITGYIWTQYGPETAFSLISLASLITLLYFYRLKAVDINSKEEDGLSKLGCNSSH
jgi:MFS family permease